MKANNGVFAGKTGTAGPVDKPETNLVVAWRSPSGQRIIASILASDLVHRFSDMRLILERLAADYPNLAQRSSH